MKGRTCGMIAATVFATCPIATGADDARFDAVYESSGAATLPDGRVLVVDDEAGAPLHLMRIDRAGDEPATSEQRRLQPPRNLRQRWRLGRLDDLEGACSDAAGRVTVIGSHNLQAGIDETDRRTVARFRVEGNRVSGIEVRRDLRTALLGDVPAIAAAMREGGKHDRDLDIEGLACDTRRDRLLIGLRAPRLDERAIVVALANPDDWLGGGAEPALERTVLDLDGGGIRAMAYDAVTDGLVLVSRDDTGKKKRFKAWWQDAAGVSEPIRLKLDDKKMLDDVEGVTVLEDARHVLFVRDDGRRDKGRTGSWFVLDRETLGLPGGMR